MGAGMAGAGVAGVDVAGASLPASLSPPVPSDLMGGASVLVCGAVVSTTPLEASAIFCAFSFPHFLGAANKGDYVPVT